jgi:PKD repeat protein
MSYNRIITLFFVMAVLLGLPVGQAAASQLQDSPTPDRPPVDIMLVLDTSDSMTYNASPDNPMRDPHACNPNDCQPMQDVKNAAQAFADQLSYPYDRLGLVTFDFFTRRNLALSDNIDAIHTAIGAVTVFEGVPGGMLSDGTASGTQCIYFRDYKNVNPALTGGFDVSYPWAYNPSAGYWDINNPLADQKPPQKLVPTGPAVTYQQDPYGPCRLFDEENGQFLYIDCPGNYGPDGNPSRCGSTFTGGAIYHATFLLTGAYPEYYPTPWPAHRQDAIHVIILLSDGAPNAASAPDGHPLCPPSTWQSSCRYPDATHRTTNPADPSYDAQDQMRDMFDLAIQENITIYTIGLGDIITSIPPGNTGPAPGETLLKYPENAGATGKYFYAPSASDLGNIFSQILDDIASPAPYPTGTMTQGATPTWMFTSTSTVTPTQTPTFTKTSTPTITPTFTKTSTATRTITPTVTETATQTETHTPTVSLTPSISPTITTTPTITLTPTITKTPTITWTPACDMPGGITTTDLYFYQSVVATYGCMAGCDSSPYLQQAGSYFVAGTYYWTVEIVGGANNGDIVNSGSIFLPNNSTYIGPRPNPQTGDIIVPLGLGMSQANGAKFNSGQVVKVTMWSGTESSACVAQTNNFKVDEAFPSPTPTGTLTPHTPTVAHTPTETATITATETVTGTPTNIPVPTITKTPTKTATITATTTVTETLTHTSVPTITRTLTETSAVPTVSKTPTSTAVPGADFVGSPLSGFAPLTVQFTALNYSILSTCRWTFGDGTSQTFNGQFSVCPSTSHVYSTPGFYSVSLQVVKATTGRMNTVTKPNYIQVTNPGESTITPTSTSVYSLQTFGSLAAQDGWVLESSQTSGRGGSFNAGGMNIPVGDDAQNRQYRGLLSFNTAGLPDNAVIVSANLKLKKQGLVGTDPFTTHGKLALDIRKPYFGSYASLEAGDFQAAAGLAPAGVVGSSPIAGYYLSNFPNTALAYVNKSGLTQLRLHFQLEDNHDLGADYLVFFSANVTNSAYRPVLEIKYSLPLTPTSTQIVTPTITSTPTLTVTPTITPTPTKTFTPSKTVTPTIPCRDC